MVTWGFKSERLDIGVADLGRFLFGSYSSKFVASVIA